MNLNKFIQFFRQSKYKILVFLNGFKIKKTINLLKTNFNFQQRKTKLSNFPRYATIEITTVCNLKCPHCPTGIDLSTRAKRFMKFEEFKYIIDQLGDHIFGVNLGPNGEPFLNKDIFRMLDYLNKKKISSFVSSNFNVADNEIIENIIKYKLNIINVGIDGASNESYSQYRINGSYNKVIDNLNRLTLAKRKSKSFWPYIIWQFLVMKTNEKEIEQARKKAKELGVDQIAFDMPFIPLPEYWYFGKKQEIEQSAKEYFPTNKKYSAEDLITFLKNCYLPWKEIHILVDGTVVPCCRLVEMNVNFGNIFKTSLAEIWNNKHYIKIRKSLVQQMPQTKCNHCLEQYLYDK